MDRSFGSYKEEVDELEGSNGSKVEKMITVLLNMYGATEASFLRLQK